MRNSCTRVVRHRSHLALSSLAVAAALSGARAGNADALDAIRMGDPASESEHKAGFVSATAYTGGLSATARRLMPLEPVSWEGGRAAFTMKLDPEKQNFLTARFWGSEGNSNRLTLFIDGQQVGYRHLGDIDQLDFGTSEEKGSLPGRFYYVTTPLPLHVTKGKSSAAFEIRASGPTYGYASEFEKYQKQMTTPARGIYAAYTHTDGFFSPPTEDVQGGLSKEVPTRPAADVEALLGKVKARLDPTLQRLMDQKRPLTQMEMQLLARAYHMNWTGAYRKPRVVTQLRDGIDNVFRAYRSNPRLAEAEPSTWNPEWFGLGPSGEVIALLREPFAATLDDAIEDGEGAKLMRRAAWSEMLVASRDWHRKHRRLYTNQSMINDLYGIYLSNKGVAAIDPASALSEEKARSYLYESIGLEPWRDSDPGGNAAPETSGAGWKAGSNYMQLTAKGLTKELGYVGYYGEVLDWVTQIYDATRPTPGQPGDEKIRKQLEKVTHARAAFRYPDVDSDGFRAMRIEAIIGWRDAHFPGNVAYAQRPSWDGSPLMAPAASLDERSIGYVQQMMEDNQFGPTLEGQFTSGGNGLRQAGGLLGVPDQYEAIAARKPTEHRLPMTPGQPDFVFSDEEDGVVALKHDDEILYVSLYWRARYAINFLARVHHITPSYHRIAVVPEEIEFTPSGEFYTRPNHINFGFGNGGPRYPDTMPKSAHAGEKLPIAMRPAGVSFRAGAESIHAGKGDFYRLPYGPYLIGMNMTSDRSYKLMVPADWSAATDLVSGKPVAAGAALDVPARTTVVLRRK